MLPALFLTLCRFNFYTTRGFNCCWELSRDVESNDLICWLRAEERLISWRVSARVVVVCGSYGVRLVLLVLLDCGWVPLFNSYLAKHSSTFIIVSGFEAAAAAVEEEVACVVKV